MVDDSGQTSGEDLTLEPTATAKSPRRRALWGVLAAVAVAAGALAVTSGGGDGPPQLPVALGASGAAEGAASAMAADMKLAWVTYLAGEGLPSLGGDGPAYRVRGTVDEATVRALADALGMTGDPTHESGVWHLQSDAAVLEVYEDGGGSWWYSANQYGSGVATSGQGCASDAGTECESFSSTGAAISGPAAAEATTTIGTVKCANGAADCATVQTAIAECPPNAGCIAPSEPCPPDAMCGMPAPDPILPPADLPSKDEARRIALELLRGTGLDLTGAEVTVDGPYDAWYVTVEPLIDGVPVSGWMASAGVGSKGAITSASGTLGTPERLGDYPLIDTRAAIDRLNAMQGSYNGGIVPMAARDAMATDSGAAIAETTTTTIASGCKVQADGSEICESTGSGSSSAVLCVPPDPAADVSADVCADPGICYESLPPVTGGDVTETTIASPACTDPVPMPEPEPVEVTLTGAERVLVLLPAMDGSKEMYLLPGYRFSSDDGAIVEVAAVGDESLAPTTTVPGMTGPGPACKTLVEQDSAGTTHTMNPCPKPILLEAGAAPEVGVAYYVDGVNTHCGRFTWAGRWWATDAQTPLPWSAPTEGGTFTLSAPEEGTFVGDAEGTKMAVFTARGPEAELPGCD
jgi:hypothetical protein